VLAGPARDFQLAATAVVVASALALAQRVEAAPVDRFPGAASAYLVVADGVPLWGANADAPLPPASLTKMMTALIVADAARPDDVVTVSRVAARAHGARIGLRPGAKLRVRDLLAGMLLRSGNDACLALAEKVAGSERAFVAVMNERAAKWGLAATHFMNACGFDAPRHLSSAQDLAALARRLLRVPELARIVGTEKATVVDLDGRRYSLQSTNLLFDVVPGVAGIKTGYTARAGRCLVGYARRGKHDVLVVLLGGSDRWWDAVAMMEQAFARNGADGGRAGPP
jgi:D-alanyl-D-alanine carboxypeptidase (penicillin-binding protein 5/6)